MSKPQSSRTTESAQKNDFASIAKTKDFKRFLSIKQATNQVPADIDLKQISDEEQKELILQFEAWIEAGKPSAQAPKVKTNVEKVLRVYRRKIFGEQKLSYVVSGKAVQEGIEFVPTYRTYKDDTTGELVEDKSMILKQDRRYTIDYTEKTARDLVARCKKDAVEPKLYLVQGRSVITIRNEANFYADFDEVISKVNNKKEV